MRAPERESPVLCFRDAVRGFFEFKSVTTGYSGVGFQTV